MPRLLTFALLAALAAGARAQDCPLGDPGKEPGPTTPGKAKRASHSCIEWKEVARVSSPPATGEKTNKEKPAAAPPRARPLLVYVYDPKDPERYFAADAHKSWVDWQVVVPTRLFECLRIPVDKARADPALRAHAKRRQLLFLRPDLTVVHAMSPRQSVKTLYGWMKKTVALDFATSVDEVWAKWQRNRNEYWKTKELMREAANRREKLDTFAARLRQLDEEEKTFYRLAPRSS